METFEAIVTRRSTRRYKKELISKNDLNQIIQAGRMAPSGGNNQTTHFIVINNKTILDELAVMVKEEFSKMEIDENMYKSLKNSIRASKSGNYVFHYNAPTLIITANKINYGNNMADCSCTMQNMMLMANELNLGSCWINQLHWLTNNERIKAYMNNLGLGEDETICASMVVGYPDTKDWLPNKNETKITGNQVTYLD